MFKLKKIIWLIFLLVLALAVTAEGNAVYHLKLLAVQEVGEEFQGSDADLFLEIREGSGRVFIDTYPITKMDTQISTRFAKEIACKYYNLNCGKYDFIYTIKAKSNIIGGPSAGAATAALTTIAVLDLDYDREVAITGTINSGGIVGPVGGIKEKLQAASDVKLNKVLIAKGARLQKILPKPGNLSITGNVTENVTEDAVFNTSEIAELDVVEFGEKNLSLKVEEVMDLDEVLFHLTGKKLNHKTVEIIENEKYSEIMKGLKDVLCNRIDKIKEAMIEDQIFLDENFSKEIKNLKERADNASKKGDYYSSASFCFGTDIKLKNYYFKEKNISKEEVGNVFKSLAKKVELLEEKVANENIETISDLQTLMVVKERVNDVKEQISRFLETEDLNELYATLAYAEERFYSALSWAQFFSMDGKKFIIDKEVLQNSCLQKVLESEQRHQYASIFLGKYAIGRINEKIVTAREAMQNEDYDLCLIMASQAKADSNAILSSLGVSEDAIDDFFTSKKIAVERVISENSKEGIFPILGYSYYQYAQSLKEQDPYTALVYIEYALEMSDLSMYFSEEGQFLDKLPGKFSFNKDWILVLEGFLVGVIVTLLIVFLLKRKDVENLKKREDYKIKPNS